MRFLTHTVFTVSLFAVSLNVIADEVEPITNSTTLISNTFEQAAQTNTEQAIEAKTVENQAVAMPSLKEEKASIFDTKKRDFRTKMLIGGYTTAVALYGFSSWWTKDVERHVMLDDGTIVTETFKNRTSNFFVRNEGWLDEDSPNGGADKLGHAFSSYLSTRLMTRSFEWAGHNRETATELAAITAASVMVGVEIFDGFTREYGFSKEDLIMNLAGVGTGILMEKYPQLDDVIDIRFHYWRSDNAKEMGETDPISDYSGQTYLVAIKGSGIPALKNNWFTRYLELAVGYGSRGYQPTRGQFAEPFPKERNLYVGLSLNLSQVLNDTWFKDNTEKTLTQDIMENTLEYLQLPGTVAFHEIHL